jgi:hypothetical protein
VTTACVMGGAGIAAALHGRKSGSGWIALCPVHECGGSAHNPSFGIAERDGRVLVRCYAGCSQADVIAALRARALWPERQPSERTPVDRARLAREHAEARRIRREASYFAGAAALMAEWALDELSPEDPERAVHTRLLAALRNSPEAEYRVWLRREPEWAAALVRAGHEWAKQLQVALARFLVAEVLDAH